MDILKKAKEWLLDRPLPSGKIIKGRYNIIKLLGMGSFGMSYLVMDRETNETKVLKQVKPSRIGSPYGKPSYEYEIQVMRNLHHAQMPTLFDSFHENKKYFLVMDYLPGNTLEELIFENGHTFTERESFNLILGLIPLVSYLHEKGIIHRDIRLPNVMVHEGKCYLLDFGLARFLDTPLPLEEEIPLSPGKHIRREIHYRSDLYSLGHLLLFLLYTTYNETGDEEEKSWEEELTLSIEGKKIIRHLLQLDPPYHCIEEVRLAILDYLNRHN